MYIRCTRYKLPAFLLHPNCLQVGPQESKSSQQQAVQAVALQNSEPLWLKNHDFKLTKHS